MPTTRKPATRKKTAAKGVTAAELEARIPSGADRFTPLAILAAKFDLHCREASRLRDQLHRLAVASGLSTEDEKRLLLDAHDANEAVKAKRKATSS